MSYMPVSLPSASSTGRTVNDCSSVRRAMSSASSWMETPALIRRTLQALSSSLLKGMSREALSAIFGEAEPIFVLRDGPAGSLSLGAQLVTRPAAHLFLFGGRRTAGRGQEGEKGQPGGERGYAGPGGAATRRRPSAWWPCPPAPVWRPGAACCGPAR